MQFDKAKLPRFFARSGDVFLWLKGVYFNEDEIYLQFRLENQESIDFDLNFLKFSIATAYKKSSSNQKTEILPVFRYKVPKEVKGSTENHFVVVFKKFSLDRNKVLVVDLAEENGVDIDFGCRAGNCGTCITAVKSGDIDYLSEPGEKPEAGSCLACIAVPKGPVVLDA